MTRKEFEKIFLDPLSYAFDILIVFDKNGFLPKNVVGSARVKTKQCNKRIILKYNKNTNDVLQTLFHELGHYLMHGTGSNFRGRKWITELEAEYCSMYTCKLLNIYYDFYFCDNKNKKITDIDMIWVNCPPNSKIEPRHDLVKECGNIISKTIKVILFNNPQLKLGKFIDIYSKE